MNTRFSSDEGVDPESERPSTTPVVEIIPLGPAPPLACEIAAANLQALLGLPADVLPRWDLPDYAYLPNRKQYDAGRILKKLEEGRRPGRLRLGLTSQDLCLPILTYVFGEALVGGHLAVISLHRLGHQPDGSRVGQAHLFERLAKVVLHETAHALGLEHCRVRDCLMRFSVSLEHLDTLSPSFCPGCNHDLVALKKTLVTQV